MTQITTFLKRIIPVLVSTGLLAALVSLALWRSPAPNWVRLWLGAVIFSFLAGTVIGLLPALPCWSAHTQLAARWSIPWSFLGSLLGAAVAAILLAQPETAPFGLPVTGEYFQVDSVAAGLPTIALSYRVDKLAAFFIFVVFATATFTSIYSFGYLLAEEPASHPGFIAASYNLFLLSMFLLTVTSNIFWFLLLWGVLTLVSSFLVLYKHNRLVYLAKNQPNQFGLTPTHRTAIKDSQTAVVVYFIASHASLLLTALAFLILTLLASPGEASLPASFEFSAIRDYAHTHPELAHNPAIHLVFLLAFIGLGIKAGLVPFHVWLPYAHPASPANVHALMSGAMVKLSIYMLIRLFFDLLGPAAISLYWGVAVLAAGAVTSFIGVMYALVSRELKEALAYHSIENVGIIVAGLGVAMMAASSGQQAGLVTVALVACLLHILNHATFKSLLFLATGAIERLTQTTVIDQLGGLLHPGKPAVVKYVAWAFVIGAVAIAGFPPFNGYVSKWFTVQALLGQVSWAAQQTAAGAKNSQILVLIVSILAVLSLGFSFGFTAYCFVKIVGEAILGRGPRTEQLLQPERVRFSMLLALVALAVACLLLGVFGFGVSMTMATVASLQPVTGAALSAPLLTTITVQPDGYAAHTSLTGVMLLFGIIIAGSLLFVRLFARPDLTAGAIPRPWQAPWLYGDTDSGYSASKRQFTGYAFTYLVRYTFRGIYRDRSRLPFKRKPMAYLDHQFVLYDEPQANRPVVVVELFRYFYNILTTDWVILAHKIGNRFQNGDLREYITYIIMVYIVVILIRVLQIW